ncbi:MAG TPA: circadian clock KaiB family protein [Chthoniobacterales bacterium]
MADKTPDPQSQLLTSERLTPERYDLRLYIVGNMQSSTRAIANIKAICEDRLPGRYDLTVIDLRLQRTSGNDDGILVAPTLVKRQPLPVRRLMGDLADPERVLRGLHLPKGPT